LASLGHGYGDVLSAILTNRQYYPEVKTAEPNKRRTLQPSGAAEKPKDMTPVVKKNYLQPTDKIRVLGIFQTISNSIQDAASYVLLNLLYHVDSFPTPLGSSRISSTLTEKEILESRGLPSNYVSCYGFEHTLLSVIRHPRENGTYSTKLQLDTDC
jgi:hypothetical protein